MRYLVLAMALLIPSLAVAGATREVAAIETKLTACLDKDASNSGMAQCTDEANAAADRLLNRLYASAVAGLKTTKAGEDPQSNREILNRLVAAERAWVTYRSADCKLRGTEMLGGSGEGLVIINCLYAMTKDRIKSLDSMFDGK